MRDRIPRSSSSRAGRPPERIGSVPHETTLGHEPSLPFVHGLSLLWGVIYLARQMKQTVGENEKTLISEAGSVFECLPRDEFGTDEDLTVDLGHLRSKLWKLGGEGDAIGGFASTEVRFFEQFDATLGTEIDFHAVIGRDPEAAREVVEVVSENRFIDRHLTDAVSQVENGHTKFTPDREAGPRSLDWRRLPAVSFHMSEIAETPPRQEMPVRAGLAGLRRK